jgi:uncharacterized protein (TIGR03437 family)
MNSSGGLLFGFLVASLPCWCAWQPDVQFSNLVTTDDGQIVYFSSPLARRGTSDFTTQKLFRFGPAGLEVVAQVARLDTPPNTTNYYLVIDPDLSGDGSVLSYVAQRQCFGGSSCLFVELYESHIRTAGAEIVFSGQTRISRDGAYAVRFGLTGYDPTASTPQVMNIGAKQTTTIPGRVPPGHPIANGGAVLADISGSGWSLWTPSSSRLLPAIDSVVNAYVSANGAKIAWENGSGLFLLDVGSGAKTQIASGAGPFFPSLSNDGAKLLYVASSQAFLRDSLGTATPVTNAVEGIREAVISGNGNVGWAITNSGRLLKIDLAARTSQVVLGPVPLVTEIEGAPLPGSLNWARGSGWSDQSYAAAAPLPEQLGGVSLALGSTRMKLLSISPSQIVYQIPFETAPETYQLAFEPADPVFSAGKQVTIVDYQPAPIYYGRELVAFNQYDPAIANAPFTQLVNSQNPARPGDLLHVYMTGLGQAIAPVPSGEAAPPDRPSPAIRGLDCVVYKQPGQPSPVEVNYAGMAPGFIGIYQIDLRVPADIAPYPGDPTRGSVLFECAGTSAPFSVPLAF